MNFKKKIGWQKYEDLLQNQLESPFLDSLYNKISGNIDDEEDDDDGFNPYKDGVENLKGHFIIPINERMMENISLTTNFDCWVGHTNFNITEEVRDKLSDMDGVEILKICSRYRFFVGIGRMFDFSEVRKNIEKIIAEQGEKIEQENREVSE
jgi:hypothetical protein